MPKHYVGWVALVLSAAAAVAAKPAEPAKRGPGLMLTSRALLEERLYARDGSALGSLAQILVDAEAGQIRFVAVELPERTVAVPWHRLRVGDDGRVHLDASITELLGSPSVDRARLDGPTTHGVPIDARAMTTLHAVIEKASLRATPLSEDGDELVTMLVATDDLRFHVLLAPESYLVPRGLPPGAGEWVEIVGVQTVISGEPTLVAYELRLAEVTIRLRQADGTPLWERDESPS